jgi:acyl-CoA synthetase (AMP-forming)/AMP-acid ligase II/acyl carrier protein
VNYARYAAIHARHLSDKICLIERTPSKNCRRTLTWKEFNDRINKVSNYLSTELKIKEKDFVLHLQYNSLEWLITYFAIIKIGAIVVPLNFRFSGHDILYAANVCKPKNVILGSEFIPVIQSIQKTLDTVKSFICIGEKVPDDMIDYQVIMSCGDRSEAMVDVEDQHDLALMFTCGTTGDPKAVLHTHYSMNNTAIGNGMTFFVRKNDNHVFFLPLYHSGSMFHWAPFYATGATGTILKEFNNPKWIIEAMAEEKGTDVFFVVPIAVALLNSIDKGQLNLADYDLSRWRYVEIGAQPAPFNIMKRLVETFPCGVFNSYGITEGGGGGVICLYPEEVLQKPGAIGKPTFGAEGKIIDPEGKELGPGITGELLIKTNRMMKGYFSNSKMTEKILKSGWLYTGDLVKTDEDGYYYIVDRAKDVIISGGENIFPEEIEVALTAHPKINDVACIGYPDSRLVEIALAVVELKNGEFMAEPELIEFAKSKLALYKVPRRIIFDKVQRNSSGKLMKPEMRKKYTGRKEAFLKLDQEALFGDRHDPGLTLSAADFLQQLEKADPGHRSEMLLEHIRHQVGNVLKLDTAKKIKIDQGFVDLGMDSVMAVELTNRLMSSLDCVLPATLVFDYPTIEAISEYLTTCVSCLNSNRNPKKQKPKKDIVREANRDKVEKLSDNELEKELASELEKAGY